MIGLWLAAVALAGEVGTDGEVRLIGSLPPDLPVDARGTTTGQGMVLDSRLRGGLSFSSGDFRANAEVDVLAGQLAGDVWDIPGDELGDERRRDALDALSLAGVTPRKASVGLRTGTMDLEVGLTTSSWGLGMVANDGAGDPLFGRADLGDRVVRLRAATAPWMQPDPKAPQDESRISALYLVAAVDMVVADDLARVWHQQRAYQGVLSTLYSGREGHRLGLYVVGRRQHEATGAPTTAFAGDVFAALPANLGNDWTAKMAVEAAGIVGRTQRALSYQGLDGLGVSSAGVAVQTELSAPDRVATLYLRGGWASGDGDPDDGATHDFTFDRNYDVGMVLFDEVGGATEAGTYALLTDGEYAGQPPPGVDAVPTEGAFRRAAYLQPAIGGFPVDGLELRFGVVVAWATAPIAHPFYSFRAGGEAYNLYDQPTTGRALGTEIDVAAIVGNPDSSWAFRPQMLVQYGHAMLSDDLTGAGPGSADLLTATLRGRW